MFDNQDIADYTRCAMQRLKPSLIFLLFFIFGLLLVALPGPGACRSKDSNIVYAVDIEDMIINPVAAELIAQAINTAQAKGAQCLVVRLDTPGGLLETTHKIVKEIMNSPVPVATYVWPQGARAASAGVFITMASHIAAMAESTHIGAAHPVIMNKSWGSIDSEMRDKITNDSVAWMDSLAKTRNRNAQWAKQAVTESVSITERKALRLGVIDVVAKDLNELLEKIDGKTVQTAYGRVEIHTRQAQIEYISMSLRQNVLNHIINPNIAYILMMLGFFGLLYEITHPGFGFSGLAGIISLLLAFYAFQVLPTNYAGLALIILGIAFFVIEAFTPAFGAFTLAGIVSLVFGSTILFNQPYRFLKVSLSVIIPVAAALGLISTFLVALAIKAQRKKVLSGKEALLGEKGTARTNIARRGKVFIHGEIWDAQSNRQIKKGEAVIVEKVEGLKLTVKKEDA